MYLHVYELQQTPWSKILSEQLIVAGCSRNSVLLLNLKVHYYVS